MYAATHLSLLSPPTIDDDLSLSAEDLDLNKSLGPMEYDMDYHSSTTDPNQAQEASCHQHRHYQKQPTASTEETSSSCGSPTTTATTEFNASSFTSSPSMECLYPVTGHPSNIHDDYSILHNKLGSGCNGTVRDCVHHRSNQVYAVKSIAKSKVRHLRHLRQESQILSSVQHPSMIRMVDCYEDETYVHIVTEKCSGGELYDRIDQYHEDGTGSFDERSAARIIKSLLEVVAYLHAQGWVHRDIKPENILFVTKDEESPIKLIDFGLARRHRHNVDCNMSSLRGTVYYLSPEVLNCNYSTPTDIWSTGVVAYLLLCGYPPFNGNNDCEIYASIARGDLEFPADIGWTNKSPECIDFIKGLLQRDPRRRLTAQEALIHPWIVQMTSSPPTPEVAVIQQQESLDERRQVPSFGPPYFNSIPLLSPPFPPSDIFTMA